MIIAIPVVGDKLCMHFGHCEKFALIAVEEESKKIISEEYVEAPPHEPGLLPGWLAEKGANCIIAGGMGQKAKNLFSEKGINVIVGAASELPVKVVEAYLDGKLETGPNCCDH